MPRAHEKTPLLRKTVSFSNSVGPCRNTATTNHAMVRHTSLSPQPLFRPQPIRRPSTDSARTLKYHYSGKSTFGQTVHIFLISTQHKGPCSCTLSIALQLDSNTTWNWHAFRTPCLCLFWLDWRHASNSILWIFNLLYVRVNNHCLNTLLLMLSRCSAKILSRIILSDPQLRSYSDVGRKAFGRSSIVLTSALFCLELFALRFVLSLYEMGQNVLTCPQCRTCNVVWRFPAHCCTYLLLEYLQAVGPSHVRAVALVFF